MSLVGNTVEVCLGSNKERTVRYRHRGVCHTVELIGRQLFKLPALCYNHGFPVFAQEVYSAVGVNRRSRIVASQTFAPVLFAGPGVYTGSDAAIAD